MALYVQKYGGRSLEGTEKVLSAAQRIQKLASEGHQVIAVVSAMGETTNELMTLAKKISAHPEQRELDMLLSTGERVSASLLSMALHDMNCPAISFTGSQAGIMTNQAHTNAEIKEIKPIRLEEELSKNHVIVLAGFQGVCPETKEITTLGRGGSDVTAVAMASHFKAEGCEILKEVDGIYSADPQIIEKAQPIADLSYQQLHEITYWGAKVLHHRAAELANELKVPMKIALAHGEGKTTAIQQRPNMNFVCINSIDKVQRFETNLSDQAVREEHEKLGVIAPRVLARFDYNVLVHYEGEVDLKKINTKFRFDEKEFSSVSITSSGNDAHVAQVISDLSMKKRLRTHRGFTHTVFVDRNERENAVRELHDVFYP